MAAKSATPTVPAKVRTPMSDEHKAALAQGRNESRAVSDYLDALQVDRPGRGRRRTPESIRTQLARIEEALPGADAVNTLKMAQARRDLTAELERMEMTDEMSEAMSVITQRFVQVAKSYGERQGISYLTWRECGVPADVLKAAGITRSGTNGFTARA